MTKVIILLLLVSPCYARENLRKAGDIIEFANPIIAYTIAAYHDDDACFLVSYAQVMIATGIGKWSGKKLKYDLAKRPNSSNFTGMPSGHTASAWLPAAYFRVRRNQPIVTSLLYGGAIATGFSRIYYKRHTVLQVLVSVVLCESVAILNSRFANSEWLQIHIGLNSCSIIAHFS